MAITENNFTGNGVLDTYSFTFPYIDEGDIKVSLDGVDTTAYTLLNATTIQFDSVPSNGVLIRIYRETDVDDLKATFFAGSSIRSQDLNDNFLQNNYRVQELTNTTWDNEKDTIHSDETWVSSDTQVATTAAMDQRFLDETSETVLSTDTWISDDDRVATTAAIDARFQDELNETITSSETWVANDDAIATTQAIEDRIDEIITTDIGVDSTGLTVTDDGDGTITLGIGTGSVDLDKIKPDDIVTSAEVNPNNDTTIATTAKIDDMIDAAITGDIAVDSTGLTLTDDGDGTITLGIGAGSVDLDRIKASDIITLSEQNAAETVSDGKVFTSSAAARRFDTLVQLTTPTDTNYQIGKTWLQNDDDLTLSVWNGTGWTAISSGGTFREQTNVVYVDPTGDDTSTGHRISNPKQTIKAAINQINAEIDTELTSGGSGYVDGTYNGVSLTGGQSTGLQANIVVTSGIVTTAQITDTATLENYAIGDVLSADNSSLGGTGSGLQITVTGDGDGQIVIVAAGVYQEVAPIQIKRRNVSIIGQALRSCLVHPTVATEKNTLFELNSGSYVSQLTLTGVKAGTSGSNTLDPDLPTDQGWNFAFYNNAYITKSPYIQNCTNFSDSGIDNSNLNAHNPAGGAAGDLTSNPTGGGLLVNGATVQTNSPLRSMVCDSYTHVGLNGPGILVTNNGYVQATSSYAFFNKYHIKCLNGGQANLAASTTDFGEKALIADGKSPNPIFAGAVNNSGGYADGDITFNVDGLVAGSDWFGSTQRPASNMLVEVNSVIYPILSATPVTGGYAVTISRPDPNNRSNNLGLNGVINDDAVVAFYLRSQIASSGHTMEYVGSGMDYSALPENGGVPDETKQITELNNGKVWTAITDHNGKFKIGGNQIDDPFFTVDQQLGFVTIPEGSIAFNLLSDTTPQLGGDLDVNGQTITSVSNGNVVIDPDGTGNIQLDASVGIGTSSPSKKLEIAATSAEAGIALSSSGRTLVMTAHEQAGVSQATKIGTTSNHELRIITNDTERMRINTTGYVGLGESSPDVRLHLTGAGSSNSSIRLENTSGPNVQQLVPGVVGVSNTGFSVYDVSNTTTTFRIDSSGQVGIGTTSPDAKLNVVQSSTGRTWTATGGQGDLIVERNGNSGLAIVAANASASSISFGDTDDENAGFIAYYHNVNALAFRTNGSGEDMRIDSSGRVGIGTSSPGEKLTVASGNIQLKGTTYTDFSDFWSSAGGNNAAFFTPYGYLGSNGGFNVSLYANGYRNNSSGFTYMGINGNTDTAAGIDLDPAGKIYFRTGTASGTSLPTRLTIDEAGEVGIGTSSPDYKLHVNGGSLGTTANDTVDLLRLQAATNNIDGLRFELKRTSAGTDWATVANRIYRRVDSTDMGYISFGHRESDLITFGEGSTEYVRIDGSGKLLVGTTSAGEASADDLTIATSGATGITIRSGTTSTGNIFFSDGTSGADEYRGYIQYFHDSDYMRLGTNGTERMRIESDGKTKFFGSTYGVPETITASSFDMSASNFFTVDAVAVPNPSGDVTGMSGLIVATAAPTSFGSEFKFPGGSYTAPTSFPAVAPFYVQTAGTSILVGNWTEGIT